MKKCPYCAEEIQDEAIVCRYCGKDFISHVPMQTMTGSEKKVLEKWGLLQKDDKEESEETRINIMGLLKDSFNFTILLFGLNALSLALNLISYQGSISAEEFWWLLMQPIWIYFFIMGIPISWVWRKSLNRFGKSAGCVTLVMLYVVARLIYMMIVWL